MLRHLPLHLTDRPAAEAAEKQKAEEAAAAAPSLPPSAVVAWTHSYKGGRVFYTSLGHPDDFEIPSFRRLFRNGILWTLKLVPETK